MSTATRSNAPQQRPPALRLDVARLNDNELILFDREQELSWILYPPRSRYAFVKRLVRDALIVERRSWKPFTAAEEHVFRLQVGCTLHGITCPAQDAVQAAVDLGWDPFK